MTGFIAGAGTAFIISLVGYYKAYKRAVRRAEDEMC